MIGGRILEGSDALILKLAREIALTHHERWDGTGYPFGLERDEIPMSGRIVAVVDAYDVLVHNRVYHEAVSTDEAAARMRASRETHFDPFVLDIFLDLLPFLDELPG